MLRGGCITAARGEGNRAQLRGLETSKPQVPLRNCFVRGSSFGAPCEFPTSTHTAPTIEGCVCTSMRCQRAALKHKTRQSPFKTDLLEPLCSHCMQEKLLPWKSPTPAWFDILSFLHSHWHALSTAKPKAVPAQPALNTNLSTSCQVRAGLSSEKQVWVSLFHLLQMSLDLPRGGPGNHPWIWLHSWRFHAEPFPGPWKCLV